MLRAGSKINKTGIFEEPANPNSSLNFFKAAKDWNYLSGYVSSLSSDKKNPNFPESPHPTFTNRIEISHESHEQKVNVALSYLFLRDLGCSREDAMFLTNRRKADRGEFVTSLPPALKKGFKQKMKKSRCLPCRPDLNDEEFDSISKAFKNLIIRKQVLYDSAFPEQEKYEKKVKSELKKLKKYRKDESDTPVPLGFKTQNLDIRLRDVQSQGKKRIIVPDVPVVKEYISVTPNVLATEEISTVASPVSRLLDCSGMKFVEQDNKIEEFRSSKNISDSTSPKGKRHGMHSPRKELFYSELNTGNNFFCQQTKDKPNTPDPLKISESNKALKYNQPSEINKPPLSPDRSELNFHTLASKERKLIDLLMIQKLQNGRIKAEIMKDKQKQVRRRKIELDAKQSHAKLAKFEQKKQKILKLLMSKEKQLITRVKSAG